MPDSPLPAAPTAAEPAVHEVARARTGLSLWLLARIDLVLRLGLLIIIIIAVIFFTLDTIPQGANATQATFISGGNLQNIARQMAVIGVIAATFLALMAALGVSARTLARLPSLWPRSAA